jgi:hypothetical protein
MNQIVSALCTVLDAEHAEAVIDHRRVTIKKPLSVFAAKLLAKRLAEWGDANEAAEIMIERVWQGFDKSWVKDRRSSTPLMDAPEGFRQLFNAYPVRDTENWSAALEAYNSLIAQGENMQFVLHAAGWLKASQPQEPSAYKESIRFLPTLATWLSDRRYEGKREFYNKVSKAS